jgi:ribonuclease HI
MIKTFEGVANSRLEFEGVLWALSEAQNSSTYGSTTIYTDCQSISALAKRRQRLESSNFMSKRSQKLLAHHDIYKEIFKLQDLLNPKIIWLKGHSPRDLQKYHHKIFALVDQHIRSILRESI